MMASYKMGTYAATSLSQVAAAAANIHSKRQYTVQHRGSLPLKKRRIDLVTANSVEDTCLQQMDCSSALQTPALSAMIGSKSPAFRFAGNEEAMAALALVSAATTSYKSDCEVPSSQTSSNALQSCFQAYANLNVTTMPVDAVPTTSTWTLLHQNQLLQDEESLQPGPHEKSEDSGSSDGESSSEGAGKDSDSNLLSLKRSHEKSSNSSGKATDKVLTLTKAVQSSTTAATNSVSSAVGAHQDKRYTGTDDETRCQATTTRGRACAYVSVNGTKYCYLHADYDTNPPPRRGGVGAPQPETVVVVQPETATTSEHSSATKASSKKPAKSRVVPSAEPPSPIPAKAEAKAEKEQCISKGKKVDVKIRSGPAAAPSGCSGSKAPRRTNAKLAEKHAESPFPLLSMISSDQWHNKQVKVAVGPLADRIGTVEKWGNGWVSVRIAGVGLHNRRSFELFLLTDEVIDYDNHGGVELDSSDGIEVQRDNENNSNSSSTALARCVSRDVVSPTPSTMSAFTSSKAKLAAPSRMSSLPNQIPATPRPEYEEVSIPDTPLPNLPESTSQRPHQPANVTPNSPEKTAHMITAMDKNMPLVDSLLLSQDGRDRPMIASSSSRMEDLLFGAAALERARRTGHKPSSNNGDQTAARINTKVALCGRKATCSGVDSSRSPVSVHSIAQKPRRSSGMITKTNTAAVQQAS